MQCSAASWCRVGKTKNASVTCIDTSTPMDKMVFRVLGAVAELERTLIAERVRAGLRNARAKGVRLGRPRVYVDTAKVVRLRAQGVPWRKIARQVGVSAKSCRRAWQKANAGGLLHKEKNPASRASVTAQITRALPAS